MKRAMSIKQRRLLWLAGLKSIAEKCYERDSRLSDLCPGRYAIQDQAAKTELLKAIGKAYDVTVRWGCPWQ